MRTHQRIHRSDYERPGWTARFGLVVGEALTLVIGIALIVGIAFFATWTGR